MPFSHVRNSYQPEQLQKLNEAFDLALCQIMLAHSAASDIQLEQLRQRLANFIVRVHVGESSSPKNWRRLRCELSPPDARHDLSVGGCLCSRRFNASKRRLGSRLAIKALS